MTICFRKDVNVLTRNDQFLRDRYQRVFYLTREIVICYNGRAAIFQAWYYADPGAIELTAVELCPYWELLDGPSEPTLSPTPLEHFISSLYPTGA